MKLSIIIPVYNEEKTIKQVLKSVAKVILPCQKEIIVVDDGSSDATVSEIKNLKLKIKNLKIIYHTKNQGKGASIQTGIKHATGDYILIQDADLEYNPEEIPKLLTALKTRSARWQAERNEAMTPPMVEESGKPLIAVYGSRFAHGRPVIPLLYYLGNIFLTKLTNLLYGCKLTDMETGYKLLPASFLKTAVLSGNRFEIEPEITIKLIKNHIPIKEVPISYHGRNHFAGKKLTVKDALGAVKMLIQYRFNIQLG